MSVILFADDDLAMRQMVADLLRAAGHQVRLASDGRRALVEVRQDPLPDLVILDYRMGTPNGLEVCRAIKSAPRLEHLPVLILTAQGEVEDRIQGFNAGADDYLAKPFDARELLARVSALLRLSRQALDRNPTTGLPGGEAIRREIDRRREVGAPFSICYLDLDNFKPFGDHFGFAIADEVIREVGQAMTTVAERCAAFAGHVGGDDFILICDRDPAPELVAEVMERFRAGLLRHLPPEVAEAGSYRGVDRDGKERDFPLTRLSAAIVHTDGSHFSALTELSELVADTKGRAKRDRESGIAEIDLLA